MQKPKVFIFDLNGTMIDDMQFHITAWSDILNNELHANLSREEVKKQMYGKNEELLVRVFGEEKFSKEQMQHLSMEKERKYQKTFLPHLKLIDGLQNFLEQAFEQNILLAIGSAAITFNIDFVLDNLDIRKYFSAIVSADDVSISKPNPETYLKVAEKLKVEARDCIVFEDAPKGIECAANAKMQSVVITTMHEKDEFNAYNNVLFFIKDYNDKFLDTLIT